MGKDVTNELIEDSQTNDNGATQRIVKSNRSVDELPDAVPTTLAPDPCVFELSKNVGIHIALPASDDSLQ
jgi:hypothetical protein